MQPGAVVQTVPVRPEPVSGELPPETGGFGLRVAARLLDFVFGFVVGAVAGMFAGLLIGIAVAGGALEQDAIARLGQVSWGSALLWGLASGFFSSVVWEWVAGTTPGKLLLGLRVVGVDQRPCSLRGAVVRSVAYFLDGLFFGVPAYVSMSDSPLNQRLGDKWGRTVVAKRSSLPPHALRSTGTLLLGLLGGSGVMFFVTALSVLSRVF